MVATNHSKSSNSSARRLIVTAREARALLAGATQVRRVLRNPGVCEACFDEGTPHNGSAAVFGGGAYLRVPYCEHKDRLGERVQSPLVVGGVYWIAEAWGWIGEHHFQDHRLIYWRAERDDWLPSQRWRSAATMPAWASRMSVVVEAVRVERVPWAWVAVGTVRRTL